MGWAALHRHTPELLQNFQACGAESPTVSFTPMLVPMSRGILATCTAPMRDPSLTRNRCTELRRGLRRRALRPTAASRPVAADPIGTGIERGPGTGHR